MDEAERMEVILTARTSDELKIKIKQWLMLWLSANTTLTIHGLSTQSIAVISN
jgi:hypothetical protein